jgi:hypothetical protein
MLDTEALVPAERLILMNLDGWIEKLVWGR